MLRCTASLLVTHILHGHGVRLTEHPTRYMHTHVYTICIIYYLQRLDMIALMDLYPYHITIYSKLSNLKCIY